jgi:hypothetical protein
MQTPALHAITFLIQACESNAHDAVNTTTPIERNFDERVEWMIDLFERLSVPRKRI